MNASTVLVLVERHKLEQDAATQVCNLHLGTICEPCSAQVQVAYLAFIVVPHCIPIDAGARSPDLQQLALVVFLLPSTSANTLLALGVVTLGNLHWWLLIVHRSTGAYTACADCNLHCVVVMMVLVVNIYIYMIVIDLMRTGCVRMMKLTIQLPILNHQMRLPSHQQRTFGQLYVGTLHEQTS